VTDVGRLEALLARVAVNRAKPRPPRVASSAAAPEPAPLADVFVTLDAPALPDASEFESPALHAAASETPALGPAHETLHGIPAPTLPPAPPSMMVASIATPLDATPLTASEPDLFEPVPLEPMPLASEPEAAAARAAEEPLLSVLPAAFDDTDEQDELTPAADFDEFDEHEEPLAVPFDAGPSGTDGAPAAVFDAPAAPLAAAPVSPGAISPPSEPLARIAAPLPEPAPTTFGGLLRRTLALRPR